MKIYVIGPAIRVENVIRYDTTAPVKVTQKEIKDGINICDSFDAFRGPRDHQKTSFPKRMGFYVYQQPVYCIDVAPTLYPFGGSPPWPIGDARGFNFSVNDINQVLSATIRKQVFDLSPPHIKQYERFFKNTSETLLQQNHNFIIKLLVDFAKQPLRNNFLEAKSALDQSRSEATLFGMVSFFDTQKNKLKLKTGDYFSLIKYVMYVLSQKNNFIEAISEVTNLAKDLSVMITDYLMQAPDRNWFHRWYQENHEEKTENNELLPPTYGMA